MTNDFDTIAPVYDRLARLVYGHKQIAAKETFFDKIPGNAHALIVGGGTGNILNVLLSSHRNVRVDFMEPSHRMIETAKRNLDPQFFDRVTFLKGTHNDLPTDARYDVVTAFFLLDMFKQDDALVVARRIDHCLKPGGLWLFADFASTTHVFHRLLLWTMYRFFKIAVNVDADRLPDFDAIFKTLQLQLLAERQLMNGFILSRVFVKR